MYLLFILSFIILVVGFFFAGRGFQNLEVLYKFNNFQTEQIDQAQPGLAEVHGAVAVTQDELTAPFSGESCVLYGILVEEKHQQGDGPLWQDSSAAQNGIPFYLEDESGEILVDPDGIEFNLPEKNVYEVPNGVVPPDPIRQTGASLREGNEDWVETLDLNLLTCQTSRDTRYREFYLEPGEECYVFGSVIERKKGRNAYYDDRETYVVYQTDSTPAFRMSKTAQSGEVEATIAVLPWMTSAAIFIMVGMLGLSAALA